MKTIVYDSLLFGKESAIPATVLANIHRFSSVRKLQKQIERERAAGAVILSDPHGRGYYRSNDPRELKRFIRTMYARAGNTLRTAESAQRALDAITRRIESGEE